MRGRDRDADYPDRPPSTTRDSLLDFIRAGLITLGRRPDPVPWLDAYAAEVWDEGRRHRDDGTINPYYEGRPPPEPPTGRRDAATVNRDELRDT